MKTRAFTLIELLMVSAIISLLMSMVFFRITEAKKKSEDAHMKAESAQVAKAVYQYKEDNGGKVPGHLSVQGPQTLVEGSDENGAAYVSAMQELVTGGYLSEIPTSPAGNDYSYIISEDETEAVFAADLNYEDTSSGGGGGSRNSCELTQTSSGPATSTPVYPILDRYVFYDCGTISASECPNPGQTDDTHMCFAVTASTISQQCECGFSVNAYYPDTFPVSICNYHVYLDNFINDNGDFEQIPYSCNYDTPQQTTYYSCEIDYSPPEGSEESPPSQPSICDGSMSTDYCTCL